MASESAKESKSVSAPYLPYKTLLSSFEPFTQGLPPKVDRSLWSQSGLTQGLIMNALRFFRLIDDDDRPTRLFHQVISKKGEERKAEIANLLRLNYPAVFEHDLMTMTPKMLDEILEKKYGVGGETKKKAATFFLQAAKDANIPLGNFLRDKIRNTSGPRKRRKSDTTVNTVTTKTESGLNTARTKTVALSNSGGMVTLTVDYDPFSLSKEDRDFVYELIDKLQQYEDAHPADEDEEEGQ